VLQQTGELVQVLKSWLEWVYRILFV